MSRQIMLEKRYASFNQMEELEEFFLPYFVNVENNTLIVKVLCMVCLHRRLPLEAVVNIFSHEEPQTLANILMQLAQAGWLGWDERREDFVTYALPNEVMEKVFSKFFPMPLVEPPQTLHDERGAAYHTERSSQSVLGEYSGQRTNLDTLNLLNAIPLRVNQAVLATGIPNEDPKFHTGSTKVFSVLKDRPFWLTWQFDFRGRVYARGYHVNPQGDDWHKAVVEFAT